jgi:prevent-host-death family protein
MYTLLDLSCTLALVDVAMSALRANLKAYVARARHGERVVVTDRGVPVARLVPVDAEGILDQLEREGSLTRPPAVTRPRAHRSRRVVATGPVAEIVTGQRRGRDHRVLR